MNTPNTLSQSPSLLSAMLAYVRPHTLVCVIGLIALFFESYFMVLIPGIISELINGLETLNETTSIRQRVDYLFLLNELPRRYQALGDPGFFSILAYPYSAWSLFFDTMTAAYGRLNSAFLIMNCFLIALLSALSGMMLFSARWLIIGASRDIERCIRNDMFEHVLSLTPRFFHNMKTGDLMTRFASDIEGVRLLIGPGIMYPAQVVLLSVLAFGAMLTLDWGLTLIITIPITILLIYVNYLTRALHVVYREAQEIYSTMAASVQENLNGIRVVKAYCQEEAEFERFRDINERYVNRNIEQIKLRGKLFPFMRMIGGIGIVLILWFGGLRVMDGMLSLGDLVQFAIYYQMLMWPMMAMGWIINVIHRGVASWRRLRAVMETEPDVQYAEEPPTPENALLGGVEMRGLTFSYDANSPAVLKDISFSVDPGSTLAIVGPTGCGKTTLVNVLLHLYSIPRGYVFFDGKDINDIPRDTLRESIAYVSQEVFLFSDTVRNNILFGINQDEVSEERLWDAVERAQLAPEIDTFSDGLDTWIGERGITLSGGQKQRVGIARALILNRPILILDDCLSAVDTHTEEAILRGLSDAIHRSTAILISHRISTVKNAHSILVLSDGEIVEAGDHDHLVEHEGLYATIHRRQLLEESLGIRS